MVQRTSVPPLTNRALIAIGIFCAIILYLAGTFTGFSFQYALQQKVNADYSELRGAIDSYALDAKNIQLQLLIVESVQESMPCESTRIYLEQIYPQLQRYWSVLPDRLETTAGLENSHDFIALKREYLRLSLRAWLIAKTHYTTRSSSTYIPILSFYTASCDDCLRQAYSFDAVKEDLKLDNQTVLVFPIDAYFYDDSVELIKKLYNVTNYPTVIIGDSVYSSYLPPEVLLRILEK